MSKYTRWVIKKGGKKGNKNSLGSWKWRVRKQKKKNKRPQFERWKSYIFHMKYLKTHSERFWVLLPSFSCYFFWKRMHFQNELMDWETKPRQEYEHGCDGLMWFKEKRTKVPCFPYSPTFHEDYDSDKNATGRWKNSLYNRELDYKQLWCAPLQRDAAWEITLCLNKPTMKHNATVEKHKANNVITRRSLQGDITQLCDLPDFQSEALVCGLTRGWWGGDGDGGTGGQSTTKKTWVKSVTINSS